MLTPWWGSWDTARCVPPASACLLPAQLTQLLDEVARLQGTPLPREGGPLALGLGTPSATPLGTPQAQQQLQLLTSSEVIDVRLVSFRNLGELVEQNR